MVDEYRLKAEAEAAAAAEAAIISALPKAVSCQANMMVETSNKSTLASVQTRQSHTQTRSTKMISAGMFQSFLNSNHKLNIKKRKASK